MLWHGLRKRQSRVDVDPWNEAGAAIIFYEFVRRSSPQRLPNGAPGNSAGPPRHGAGDRSRTAGRLFYRSPLLQTGFQILGLRAPARPALEHGTIGNVERERKTRPRSGAIGFWERQQLRIQTLRPFHRRQGL